MSTYADHAGRTRCRTCDAFAEEGCPHLPRHPLGGSTPPTPSTMIRITESEAATIVKALRVAADRYDTDARELSVIAARWEHSPARTVEQWRKQAREARRLADDLEQRGA